MNVQITTETEDDLERIGDYIAQNNPRRALSFITDLRDKCIGLAEMYEAFSLVACYGLRRLMHGNYVIFYKVETDHIVVIHILHGAMDYSAILQDSI